MRGDAPVVTQLELAEEQLHDRVTVASARSASMRCCKPTGRAKTAGLGAGQPS